MDLINLKFYLPGLLDSRGGKSYKLCLPPNIPVKNFWSVVVYDTQARSGEDEFAPGGGLLPLVGRLGLSSQSVRRQLAETVLVGAREFTEVPEAPVERLGRNRG